MQIRHQLIDLLLRELVLEAGHLGTAEQDDIQHTIIVGRNAAGHELFLEKPVQAGSAQVAGGVRIVALGAARVIDPAARRLLGIKSELGVGFARLNVTGAKGKDKDKTEYGEQ